ncbi:hypothetical protein VTK56DRAFT_6326 [Thermocarpiscus australiensis]
MSLRLKSSETSSKTNQSPLSKSNPGCRTTLVGWQRFHNRQHPGQCTQLRTSNCPIPQELNCRSIRVSQTCRPDWPDWPDILCTFTDKTRNTRAVPNHVNLSGTMRSAAMSVVHFLIPRRSGHLQSYYL